VEETGVSGEKPLGTPVSSNFKNHTGLQRYRLT
jgi:hypothetical protein